MPKEPLNLSTGILLSLIELRLGSKGKATFRNVKKGNIFLCLEQKNQFGREVDSGGNA